MTFPASLSRTEHILILLALAVIIILGMQMMGSTVTIFLVALILTMLFYPAARWLRSKGLSNIAAVSIVTTVAALCIVLMAFLTLFSFNMIVTDLPQYQTELEMRFNEISSFLGTQNISLNAIVSTPPDLETVIPALLSSIKNFTQLLMDIFFVAITTFFMLLEAPQLIERAKGLLRDEPEKLRHLSRMSGYVIDFIVVRTETNLIHGVLFGGSLWVIGVHGAILWGVLTFILCYIPFFGLIIAAIPAIFFAWLQFGIPGVAAVVIIVCLLNLIVENPVFSWLAARKFEIPALVVILSVIFWGWLFGLVGMLFSVPYTMILLTFVQFSDDLRWINTLIGAENLFVDNITPPDTVPDKKTDL